jgi:hypothetical protein
MVNRLYPDQGAYGPADGIRARPSLTLYPICITTRIDWCRLIGECGNSTNAGMALLDDSSRTRAVMPETNGKFSREITPVYLFPPADSEYHAPRRWM